MSLLPIMPEAHHEFFRSPTINKEKQANNNDNIVSEDDNEDDIY